MNSQTLAAIKKTSMEATPIWIIQAEKEKISKKMEKVVILDSGPLINLSMNGLLYIIDELKKETDTHFLITKFVKYEVIDRPSGIPRFELGALRVKEMLANKIIELPESFNISEEEINNFTKLLVGKANHTVFAGNHWIQIVSNAEISCLALSSLLLKQGIENIIAVDERTTRILAEKPENLERIMASKLHQRIELSKENFKEFSQFKFIRSTELVYVAYKKGFLKINDPKALEAALFATKFHGSSVSFEEINVLKKL